MGESTPELITEVGKRVDAGAGFIVANMGPNALVQLADALKGAMRSF